MDLLPEDSYEFYKKSSIHGVKWTGGAEFFTRVFNFGVTVVLARLLTPEDFGLIALSLVVVYFIQLVIDFGISSAIIQKPEISSRHYNSSFFLVGLFSLLMSLLFFFESGFIANFLEGEATGGYVILHNPSFNMIVKKNFLGIVFACSLSPP